jgi:ABC-type uncharacterized transport system permease subunit
MEPQRTVKLWAMILAASPLLTTVLSVAAALGYAGVAVAQRHLGGQATRNGLTLAWLLHAAVLASSLLASPPMFGFAPALSVTAWLVLLVYAVESHVYPQLKARTSLLALGLASVMLAWLFPGSTYPTVKSGWLPLHWALGIAAYGLIAAAVVHAWWMQRIEKHMRRASEPSEAGIPLLAIERLTFRFVSAGFVLLTATLLAGWWFAEHLFGKAWVWDHKSVFSMLSWVVFAVLLVGRWQLGWRGRTAVRILYAGSGLLMLAYVGSRFVMEVVLHRS